MAALNFERIDHPALFNGVDAITEDAQGMIWLVEGSVLYFYDGIELHPYLPLDGLIMVYAMQFYGPDWLWLVSDVGVRKIHIPSKSMTDLYVNDLNDTDQQYVNFFIDSQKRLWLLLANGQVLGADKIDSAPSKVAMPDNTPCDLISVIGAFIEDDAGNIWLGNCHGVYRFDVKSGQFEHKHKIELKKRDIVQLDFKYAKVLATSAMGAYQFDAEQDKFSKVGCEMPSSYKGVVLSQSMLIGPSQLLSASNQGLIMCDLNINKITFYTSVPGASAVLDHNYIEGIYTSSDGFLWVVTLFGLYKSFPEETGFTQLRAGVGTTQGLLDNHVSAVHESADGTVWIGTRNGLSAYQRDTHSFTHYRSDTDDLNGLQGQRVWTIKPYAQGKMIVGTTAGLNVFDRRTGTFINRKNSPDWPLAIITDRVWDVAIDKSGVWVAVISKGLYYVDSKTGKAIHYTHQPKDKNSLSNGVVRRVFISNTGELWVGTQFGLNRFDRQRQQFVRYDFQGKQTQIVVDINNNELGEILVSFAFDGVYVLDSKSGAFTPISEAGAFETYKILIDNQSRLWGSSVDGVVKLLSKDKRQILKPLRLLRSHGFYTNAGFYGASNTVYFGGLDGLFMFEAAQKPVSPIQPEVVITTIEQQNSPAKGYGQLESNKGLNVKLSPSQKNLSIEFAALDYAIPANIRYQYRLAGFSEQWTEVGADDRRARYTNLDPGDYLFEVKSTNSEGVWNDDVTTVKVTKVPDFSQTLWFDFFIAMILLLVIAVTFQVRVKSHKRRAVLLEQQVEQRTAQIEEQKQNIETLLSAKEQLIANVSHEFRTPLTLIQGPVEMIGEKVQDLVVQKQIQVIKRNCMRLKRMVEHLLDFAKPIETIENDKAIVADQLLQLIAEPFELVASQREVSMQLGFNAPDARINIPSEQFEKIVSNLLSNAIKYNKHGGQVTVLSQVVEQQWQLNVLDTGIGIDETYLQSIFERFSRVSNVHHEKVPGAGLGLALVKELVESYQGCITVSSKPGEGSCFTVAFKLSETKADSQPLVLDQQRMDIELSDVSREHEVESLQSSFSSAKVTIQVVEDSADMCDYIGAALEGDYNVIVAHDGQQGLTLAQEQLPDIIISDIMMPVMDGYELCNAIKHDEKTSHIPVILLTALSDSGARIKGYQYLADDYLTKPFNREELKARIQSLLTLRSLMQKRLLESSVQSEPEKPEAGEVAVQTQMTEKTRQFLQKVEEVTSNNLADHEFSAKNLYPELAMSERLVQRKLKALTGQTPAEYIREKRLKKACELLASGNYVNQVCDDVGFSSHAYFSSCFKARYGVTPSAYVT